MQPSAGAIGGLRKDTMCVTPTPPTHTPSHIRPINETHQFLCGFGFLRPLTVFSVCVFDESEKCPRNGEKVGKLWLPVLSLMLCKMKVNRVRLFEKKKKKVCASVR